VERTFLMLLTFLILEHIAACMWIFVARLYDDNEGDASKQNWIQVKEYTEMSDEDLYLTSFYFCVTTVLTVGYGDISAVNNGEKVMCILLMLIGVVSFSFATGALASIISSYDSREADLKEKIATLNEIKKDYKIDNDLFNRLAKVLRYDHKKSAKDLEKFMEEIPNKLKNELQVAINTKLYQKIGFFKGKDKSFVTWIATVLKTVNFEEKDYIFKEGDHVTEVFFLSIGRVNYSLPRFGNKSYRAIKTGMTFGHSDMHG
jgi:Ion channel